MRIKIQDTWYDPEADGPICIELTPEDKKMVREMSEESTKWAFFPDAVAATMTKEEMFDWMDT